MPASPRQALRCLYRYDPLDRMIDWAASGQPNIQRFHCKSRLATEIQDAVTYSFFQHDDQVLGQQRHVGTTVDGTLLATDQQHSVLNALDATQRNPLAYSPYGHRPHGNGLLSLLGFNGERPDPVTGHYHLGNGYRQFNPVLMRFNSPDSWSPFGSGGLNAYAYCGGDPVNRADPTGHVPFQLTPNLINRLKQQTGIAPGAKITKNLFSIESKLGLAQLTASATENVSAPRVLLNKYIEHAIERASIVKHKFSEISLESSGLPPKLYEKLTYKSRRAQKRLKRLLKFDKYIHQQEISQIKSARLSLKIAHRDARSHSFATGSGSESARPTQRSHNVTSEREDALVDDITNISIRNNLPPT